MYKLYITCWNYSLGRIRSREVFFVAQRRSKIGNCELRESEERERERVVREQEDKVARTRIEFY